MSNKISQIPGELEEHLTDQIQFLESSASSFDNGFSGEAKRMANSLRVLLNDTDNSHSLLGQLGRKNILFYDISIPFDSQNLLTHSGLVAISMGPAGAKPIPLLDDIPENRFINIDFESWWNQPIFVDSNRNMLTRKELVLTMADQDGGAHVDPALEERYARLSRENSLGWHYSNGNSRAPIKQFERAAIRQITHEVLKTLKPGYSKTSPTLKSNSWFAGMSIKQVDRPTVESIRTNQSEPYPIGSGNEYKIPNVKSTKSTTRKRHRGKRHSNIT